MPKTILLADDSVTIQKVVGISFANEDVVLLTVDNGTDAITRAREARPDLVLADVMMPGRDGYEVCEALKSDPDLRHVPVLLLSGTFEPYDEERAGRVGAAGHITKPFEAQALVDEVNALLVQTELHPVATTTGSSDATLFVANPTDGDPEAVFDFFDDEMARTAPAPTSPATTLLEDDGALELEAAVDEDDGFDAFDPSDAEPIGSPAAGDSQPTALFGGSESLATTRVSRGLSSSGRGDEARSLLTEPAPAPSMRADLEAPIGYEESFDFGFSEPAPERTGTAAPAELAVPPPFPEGPLQSANLIAALPMTPDPVPPPVPAAALSQTTVAVPVASANRSSALSEPIQKQLQETLEKIVWEAFGEVTERIVRDVIERVEAVAWEVIPQMTETLIREEIRRLQDDSEES
jgi:CheY-like chemotaxis protein